MEEIKGLVSVVMPTFNCEKYILDTINSVLNQTYQNFEILLVDDCSTDDTINVVKGINDSRIRVFINDKNSGAAFSRNVALREARGEYIAFLDGDDLWHKEKLQKQIDFMILNGYSFTNTFYEQIDDEGKPQGTIVKSPKRISHRKFLKMDYIGCLTAIYKKSIFPDLQIPNDIYKRNDYALWLKISEKADCHSLPEILASYRKRTGSISRISKTSLLKYHKILYKKLYNFSSFKASFYAWRNGFFFVLKKIKYVKKISPGEKR